MELHYKIYQKVRIYLDKIQYALSNLETLKVRTVVVEGKMLLTLRIKALGTIRVHLTDFFGNLKNSIPFVPHSRCKAITSWYGSQPVQCSQETSTFQKYLIEADKPVLEEARYIISDTHAPSILVKLFEKHVERFEKLLEPVKSIKEN